MGALLVVASLAPACGQILGLDGIAYDVGDGGVADGATGDGGVGAPDASSADAPAFADGPVTLAQGPGGGQGVALDDTRVYWIAGGANGSVLSVLKDGGGVTTIATGQPFPVDIAVQGTRVYWSVTPGGAGPQCMAMVASTPESSDAGLACVTSSADVTVRMTLGGGGVVLLAQGTGAAANNEFIGVATPGAAFASVQAQGPSQAVAATGQRAFLGNKNGFHVDELALPGLVFGPVVCTANCGGTVIVDMTMDVASHDVLWITQGGGVFEAPVAVNGATGTRLAQLQTGVQRMARDGSYVYVTDLERFVFAVPLGATDGGGVLTLASGENQPFGIAVDEHAVYWVNANGALRVTSAPP